MLRREDGDEEGDNTVAPAEKRGGYQEDWTYGSSC